MNIRKKLKCALVVLALTVSGQSQATGILTFDVTAMTNALQELAYWEKQVTEMKSQLEQQKQIANRMTSELKLAATAFTDYNSLLPSEATDLLSGQNISTLKSSWGLVSSSSARQSFLDKDLEVSKMLNTLYESTKTRAANLDALRPMQNSTATAAQKADYQNRIQSESADIAAQNNQIVLAMQVAEQEKKLQRAKVENAFLEDFFK